jgi:hypothetical protein
VLPLRLTIVLSLSGVALWGLLSLLENLRAPELLRSPRAVVVKGCDPIESDDARRMCPQLFCQKALLDARLLPPKSSFTTTIDRRVRKQQLVGGVARVAGSHPASYACVLERGKIVSARLVDDAELQALASEPDGWKDPP